MTKLNDAQLEQVSGGTSRISPAQGPSNPAPTREQLATYDYGNMVLVP